MVTVSQRDDSAAVNMTYGANRARLVYSHQDSLPFEDKTTFVFSPCLILVAGSSSNITHLVGIGEMLQLIKPLAMVVVQDMTDVGMKTRFRKLYAPFPLLLIGGGGGNNGEFILCNRGKKRYSSDRIL